ncbi:MAG: hypothetical protein HC912_06730, partial [Saprospiraceae bacterium]|nr:hypothetical protein [Saprospiraceae bacterium]
EINKVTIKTIPELQEYVARFRPEDTIEVGFIRKGKRQNTKVKLHKITENSDITTFAYVPNLLQEIGLQVRDLKKKKKTTRYQCWRESD